MQLPYNDYLNFKFHQIKEFLSLYENLNYTKAAKECYISQSVLSRRIQNFEESLGIQLFVRSTSNVSPTPAAKYLYKELKKMYVNYEDALLNAYRIQEGKSHSIHVYLNDGLDLAEELLSFTQIFYKKYPDWEIMISRDYNYSLISNLLDEECDVVFDLREKDSEKADVESFPLLKSKLYAYMLKSNPLNQKDKITLEDLATQQLLIRSPSKGSDQIDFMRNLFSTINITPHFANYVSNALELAMNIQYDNQVILADQFYIGRNLPYLSSKIIEGTESVVLVKWLKRLSPESDVHIFINELISYFSSKKGITPPLKKFVNPL